MILTNNIPVPGSLPQTIEPVKSGKELASMIANKPTIPTTAIIQLPGASTTQPTNGVPAMQNISVPCKVGLHVHATGLEPVPFPKPRPKFRRRRRVPKT